MFANQNEFIRINFIRTCKYCIPFFEKNFRDFIGLEVKV
ncbi:hypothetical protein BGAPBR_I0062 (plasmid) [Borreliella garinii PBr]|uniref:Uncharacterized protein n=1 Tax=Borreliella garinii PBr TaxID=498743 RepID=B8F141_BORGR|nr:hypothetical protein BGAPBR_I0062 [Borreliella garinii PBr]